MYIKNVALKNFKCFVEQEINFNTRFNLIVGNNGVGKTSILEALSIGISGFLNEIKSLPPNDKRNIEKEDIRLRRNPISELTEFQSQYPVELDFEVEFENEAYDFSRTKEMKGRKTVFDKGSKIKELSTRANSILENGEPHILPAFAYHGTGRVWAKSSVPNKDYETHNRIFGYKN